MLSLEMKATMKMVGQNIGFNIFIYMKLSVLLNCV